MTRAALRSPTTEQVADAILALINAKPRSPTRAEIIAACSALVADNDNDPWKPTALGLEMIKRLPEHALATWYGGCVVSGDPDEEAIEAWEHQTSEAIDELARDATNIVDLAIAYRIRLCESPSEAFEAANRQSKSFGWPAPEEPEDCVDASDMLAYRLVCALLAMAGIPEQACSIQAQLDWEREPTTAERRAALAKLEAVRRGSSDAVAARSCRAHQASMASRSASCP